MSAPYRYSGAKNQQTFACSLTGAVAALPELLAAGFAVLDAAVRVYTCFPSFVRSLLPQSRDTVGASGSDTMFAILARLSQPQNRSWFENNIPHRLKPRH